MQHACPWPPVADAWRVLDDGCLDAWRTLVDAGGLGNYQDAGAKDNTDYHILLSEALKNPLGIRRAVGAALDRPECRVPDNEERPGLRETCTADDMMRLHALQGWCRPLLEHTDRHLGLREEEKTRIFRESLSQEEFYESMERRNRRDAALLWGIHTCRSLPHEVLPFFDHLPEENQNLELGRLAERLGYPVLGAAAGYAGRLRLIRELEAIRLEPAD